MPEEEVSFRSIKITLSEEALDKLELLKLTGSFRSYSMTIEETIRGLFDVLKELYIAEYRAKGEKPIPDELKLEAAKNIAVRLYRFNFGKLKREDV